MYIYIYTHTCIYTLLGICPLSLTHTHTHKFVDVLDFLNIGFFFFCANVFEQPFKSS